MLDALKGLTGGGKAQKQAEELTALPIFVTETACEGFFGPFIVISPLSSIGGCPIRDVV